MVKNNYIEVSKLLTLIGTPNFLQFLCTIIAYDHIKFLLFKSVPNQHDSTFAAELSFPLVGWSTLNTKIYFQCLPDSL